MQSIKYIVYLTICKVTKHFYVGVHHTTVDHFDGYLGNGIYTNKPSSYKKSETPLRRAVNKYGPNEFVRITLFEYDNESDAYKKEAEIVNSKFLQRKDVYNACLGGKRPPAWSVTPIHKYDLEGNYIESYELIKDAADSLKVKQCSISDAAKEHNSCKGFLWSYEKLDKIDAYSNHRAKRKVGVYDLNGNLLKTYDTIGACRKDYIGCIHVLYGRRKKHKNCTFKFID